MTFRKSHAPFLAMFLVGCTTDGGSNEEVADEDSGTETDGDGDGDSETAGTTDATADDVDGDESPDELGDDELGDDMDESAGETEGGDCEYIDSPINPVVDWEQASGSVSHVVNRGVSESSHWIHALFLTDAGADDSKLCVEWLVADGDVGIDACNVYYTTGSGLGGEWPAEGYEDLAVDTATFDLGEGPVVLDQSPGNDLNPASYSGDFSAPPDGVPFGGIATLAVTFDDLPALDLDLDVPEDVMPIGPLYGSMTLSSEELASWTWSNSGGSEPIEINIHVGPTPYGTGWSKLVRIRCNVTDDGEFAFPSEYFDLAREQLGAEIYAAATITRRNSGQVPLAGEDVYWYSSNAAVLGVEIID